MSKYTDLFIIQSFPQIYELIKICCWLSKFDLPRRRDHETLDCTASIESENTNKKLTSNFLNIHFKP